MLNFKERKQLFCFVFLACLKFWCVPTLYPSCFCNVSIFKPSFSFLVPWAMGLERLSLVSHRKTACNSGVSLPSSPGQDHKPAGDASSPSSVCSLIHDGFPIMGRDDESKERWTDGERYLRVARAAVWDLRIRWRQNSTTLSFPTLKQAISHVQSKTSPTPAVPL